jgi:hypothetical protein
VAAGNGADPNPAGKYTLEADREIRLELFFPRVLLQPRAGGAATGCSRTGRDDRTRAQHVILLAAMRAEVLVVRLIAPEGLQALALDVHPATTVGASHVEMDVGHSHIFSIL